MFVKTISNLVTKSSTYAFGVDAKKIVIGVPKEVYPN